MNKIIHSMGLRLKRWLKALRNAPLVCLTVIVSVSLEAFGWGYIFLTNEEVAPVLGVEISMALIEAIIITAAGLLALVASFVAAERRSDARYEVRRSAGAAQILAILLICPPAIKAAEAWAYTAQVAKAEAFAASEQYQTALINSRSETLDSMAVREASHALAFAIAPTRARFDGDFIAALFAAAFLYGANMAAASLLWRSKPETPSERTERERREDRERQRKRRHERELAALQIEVGKTRPNWFRGIFSGGRKAA